MTKPIENYFHLRLEELKKALEANNFEVYIAEDAAAAKKIVLEELLPKAGPKRISFGGSMTVVESGLYHELKEKSEYEIIDTYDHTMPPQEGMERRRQSLTADFFITGTNAVTETGMLVNLDMIGNRTGGLTFGPKNAVVLVGQNKIVPDLDDAMFRIKNFAAPINAMRLKKKTPCTKTGFCEECKSPDRICNNWAITEKSFPKGRIKIILIQQNMGF